MMEVVFVIDAENHNKVRMHVHTVPRIGEMVFFKSGSIPYKVNQILHVLNPDMSPLHEIEIYLDPVRKES